MKIEFVKMEGLGNDFIIMDDRQGIIERHKDYPSLAQQLCSRNFGIGADGIILALNASEKDIKFRIFNSDGSEAQMCGNGMRCFAKYLYDSEIITKKMIVVETKAGIIIPKIISKIINRENEALMSVMVDMGEPVLTCKDIPFQSQNKVSVLGNLKVKEKEVNITAVGMGNPHCVILVKNIEKVDIKKYGPLIENHARFPENTNVEFVEIVNFRELKMKVWERGSGITLACGTGACAALVAANLAGKVDEKATIHLDGGDLEIYWDKKTNHIFKTGPATEVFKGQINI